MSRRKILMTSYSCPVCGTELEPVGLPYTIEQLFDLWSPTTFSKAVIDEHRKQAKETQLYQCSSCHLEVFFPQVIGMPSFYQELATPTGGNAQSATYYEDEKWDFFEAQEEVKQCGSILEVGCGPGQFLSLSTSKNRRVVGVEYTKVAIESAKKKGLEVYLAGTLPDELFNTFDGAFSFHVLEHVSTPMEFLEDLGRYVKPGGLIAVSVPNQAGPIRFIEKCA
ncbi:MAG: methyltransferase domain-containing protein, partial [Methylomarinum sp.]|nr:methyltransferase domain-containing protein [Methylomarinum sp.]